MLRKVIKLELTEGLESVWGMERYEVLHCLVCIHGQPLGWVHVDNPSRATVLPKDQLRYTITAQLGYPLIWTAATAHLNDASNQEVVFAPITVVVCTRDRTEQLATCLDSLLSLDYPNYEILVVDNAPSTSQTADLAAQYPVRYVLEPAAGLDRARNCGIRQATHDLIAFTDDDVQVDAHWLREINRSLSDERVMAVTGFIAPQELGSWAQILYEFGYGGLMNGLEPRRFDRKFLSTNELLWASNFGAGANMAFRRQALEAVGLFDPHIDVGTPARSGGDIELLHRLVVRGHIVDYNPAAFVWHQHRRDMASLRRQLRDNGVGFGSYLLTAVHNETARRRDVLRFALVQWLGGWMLKRLLRPGFFPRRLIVEELVGALTSPLGYRRAHASAKITSREVVPAGNVLHGAPANSGG